MIRTSSKRSANLESSRTARFPSWYIQYQKRIGHDRLFGKLPQHLCKYVSKVADQLNATLEIVVDRLEDWTRGEMNECVDETTKRHSWYQENVPHLLPEDVCLILASCQFLLVSYYIATRTYAVRFLVDLGFTFLYPLLVSCRYIELGRHDRAIMMIPVWIALASNRSVESCTGMTTEDRWSLWYLGLKCALSFFMVHPSTCGMEYLFHGLVRLRVLPLLGLTDAGWRTQVRLARARNKISYRSTSSVPNLISEARGRINEDEEEEEDDDIRLGPVVLSTNARYINMRDCDQRRRVTANLMIQEEDNEDDYFDDGSSDYVEVAASDCVGAERHAGFRRERER